MVSLSAYSTVNTTTVAVTFGLLLFAIFYGKNFEHNPTKINTAKGE